MYLDDLFALLQGQFFILKFLLSLINILNIKQRVSMPSFYAFIAYAFIEWPLEVCLRSFENRLSTSV